MCAMLVLDRTLGMHFFTNGDGGNMMKLRAAGMKVVMGTDTGQTRFFIGYYNHMGLESYAAIGMTPSAQITQPAARRRR